MYCPFEVIILYLIEAFFRNHFILRCSLSGPSPSIYPFILSCMIPSPWAGKPFQHLIRANLPTFPFSQVAVPLQLRRLSKWKHRLMWKTVLLFGAMVPVAVTGVCWNIFGIGQLWWLMEVSAIEKWRKHSCLIGMVGPRLLVAEAGSLGRPWLWWIFKSVLHANCTGDRFFSMINFIFGNNSKSILWVPKRVSGQICIPFFCDSLVCETMKRTMIALSWPWIKHHIKRDMMWHFFIVCVQALLAAGSSWWWSPEQGNEREQLWLQVFVKLRLI
jgi:hypothetical protein